MSEIPPSVVSPTPVRRLWRRRSAHRGSDPGRLVPTETISFRAVFASFAGVPPVPASSGLTNRHGLDRSGERQPNLALHIITLIRMRLDPAAKAYVARRITEGKTARDAQRSLKRVVCRQLFKTLERLDRPTPRGIVDFVQAA
ncbi:transposase [Streptomyces sp. NPDC093149]|uniref:transposase n=1 Tax=Streptomyces sp. NPDC093149 TaxID=3366031 RepID=UPI0037F32B60